MKFDIPILRISNDSESRAMQIWVEPFSELYELGPRKTCDIFYHSRPDNRIPEKALEIARIDDGIVIYPPGEHAPILISDGLELKAL